MATLAQKAAVLMIALVTVSFGMFLTYQILVHVEATELMWFVFVIYVPLALVLAGASKALDWSK